VRDIAITIQTAVDFLSDMGFYILRIIAIFPINKNRPIKRPDNLIYK